jgi:hypothetical protein
MTDEEEFAARSQLKWTREGDAWILLYRRGRYGSGTTWIFGCFAIWWRRCSRQRLVEARAWRGDFRAGAPTLSNKGGAITSARSANGGWMAQVIKEIPGRSDLKGSG